MEEFENLAKVIGMPLLVQESGSLGLATMDWKVQHAVAMTSQQDGATF
jgi:hypothetical protein